MEKKLILFVVRQVGLDCGTVSSGDGSSSSSSMLLELLCAVATFAIRHLTNPLDFLNFLVLLNGILNEICFCLIKIFN
jgi:hypothetical protein